MKRALLALSTLAVMLVSPGVGAAGSDVERLLGEWRVDEAKQTLARIGRTLPPTKRAMLHAQVLFYRGRYAQAAQELQRLIAGMKHPPRRLKGLAALVRSTAAVVARHVERPSPGGHFRIFVAPGKDELLVPFIGETLEAIRRHLEQDLGYAPRKPIRVEVYGRPQDLARVSPLTTDDITRTGTVALCKYDRLMIVSPRALLRGYGWRDTLAHEYVHLVVSRMSHNMVPIWLQEGLAKYFETRWRTAPDRPPLLTPAQEHLLAEAVSGRGRLIRWSEMHPSMAKLPNQRATALAFAQVQVAVDFIARQGKRGVLRRLITAIRSGQSDWRAIERVTGLSSGRFSRTYRAHMRRLKLRRLPGLVPPTKRFGHKLTKEQELAQIRQRNARRFFRLADMLRQRRLTRAAIIEYEKARAVVGQRDALIANALARAYLELGSPDQATRALLPVVEYYPELAGPQVTLGTAYLRGGNRQAAAQHLQVALRINPFDPEIHCGLAQALPQGDASRRYAEICRKLGR